MHELSTRHGCPEPCVCFQAPDDTRRGALGQECVALGRHPSPEQHVEDVEAPDMARGDGQRLGNASEEPLAHAVDTVLIG